MKKIFAMLIAASALSSLANAEKYDDNFNQSQYQMAPQHTNPGVNMVVNTGNLFVSFGETAVKGFSGSVESARNLAKCFSDGMNSVATGVTAPVLCPVQVGTEVVTAIVIAGVHGVQSIVAVPTQFANDVAAKLVSHHQDKHHYNKDDDDQRHHRGFKVLHLGVCFTAKAVGYVFKGAAAAVEFVMTSSGKAIELVVNGVKTGVTYTSKAIIMVVDWTVGTVKIVGKDSWGTVKAVVVTAHKTAHVSLGGEDGAIQYFLKNFAVRVLTLPIRIFTHQSFEDMVGQTIKDSESKGYSYEVVSQ